MTKDVFVSITGMQTSEPSEPVEIINAGNYYKKNDMHYVLYDERIEGFDQVTKNRIKFKPGYLCVSKKGVMNTNMEYDVQKKTLNCYATPFGEIMMGIHTTSVEIEETEEYIIVVADYTLDANDSYLSKCHVKIKIEPSYKGVSLS